MTIAATSVALFLALAMGISGVQELRLAPAIVDQLVPLGVPRRVIPWLGLPEIAATIGLVVGLVYLPLGVAAAVGAVLYFIGAILAHLRAGDRAIAPAAVLMLVSVAAAVLQVLAA